MIQNEVIIKLHKGFIIEYFQWYKYLFIQICNYSEIIKIFKIFDKKF